MWSHINISYLSRVCLLVSKFVIMKVACLGCGIKEVACTTVFLCNLFICHFMSLISLMKEVKNLLPRRNKWKLVHGNNSC
jgi:hypothetical protein